MMDMTTKFMTCDMTRSRCCWNKRQNARTPSPSEQPSHLELVLLPGVALAPDVLLQVHVIFERLSGGREGNRGQKLNHQTTKHTHGKREGEKRKEKEEREGRGKQSFRFFIPREWKTRNVSFFGGGFFGPSFKTAPEKPRRLDSPGLLQGLNAFLKRRRAFTCPR